MFRLFTTDDLVEDVEAAGFGGIDVDQIPGDDGYAVTAIRKAKSPGVGDA